jgi:hypothetical protein
VSSEVRSYTLTIPAGTTQAAPASLDCTFPPRRVDTIEVIAPPGSNGAVGFYIANSNLRVIPFQSDAWLIVNNEKIVWQLDGYIDSGSWQVVGYNTGAQQHSLYFRFLLSLTTAATAGAITAPLDTSALAGPVTPGTTDDVTFADSAAPFTDLAAANS